MKYALLIYDNPGWPGLSADELDSICAEYMAISTSEGVVGGAQRQPLDTAVIVEVDELGAAIELAARIARMGGAVEVRPIVER
jgi:hypothetical protein